MREWFVYLNISSKGNEKNIPSWIKDESQAKGKRETQQLIKRNNVLTLLNLTLSEILFNSSTAEKNVFLDEFQQQYGQINSNKEKELFGNDREPIYPFRNKSQDINIDSINKSKIDGLIRAYRLVVQKTPKRLTVQGISFRQRVGKRSHFMRCSSFPVSRSSPCQLLSYIVNC
jgi:uncharacterized protein YfaP (DUF2135 family)